MASPDSTPSAISHISTSDGGESNTLSPSAETGREADRLVESAAAFTTKEDALAVFDELRDCCCTLRQAREDLERARRNVWTSLAEKESRVEACELKRHEALQAVTSCFQRLPPSMKAVPLSSRAINILADGSWPTAELLPSEDPSKRGINWRTEQHRAELLAWTGAKASRLHKLLEAATDPYTPPGRAAAMYSLEEVITRYNCKLDEDTFPYDLNAIFDEHYGRAQQGRGEVNEAAVTECRKKLSELYDQTIKDGTTLLDSFGVGIKFTVELGEKLFEEWQRATAAADRPNPDVPAHVRTAGSAEQLTVIDPSSKREPDLSNGSGDHIRLMWIATGVRSAAEAWQTHFSSATNAV